MIDPMKLPKARGNKELKKHLLGDRLTQRQAILAKCADCMGYYFDGKVDCQLPDCPLYAFMPYRIDKLPIHRESTPSRSKKGVGHKHSNPRPIVSGTVPSGS